MKKDTERQPSCIIRQSGSTMAYNQTRTNAQRFLDAYARIEKILYEIIRETKYVPFSQMITRASRENLIISARANDLRQYHELRNAIVHNRGRENEVIAEPCDSVTDDIEKIADMLESKHELLSIASSPVITVGKDDSISSAYRLMRKMNTSKIPVYHNGVYAGLITMEEIAGWALENRNETDEKINGFFACGCVDNATLLYRRFCENQSRRANGGNRVVLCKKQRGRRCSGLPCDGSGNGSGFESGKN